MANSFIISKTKNPGADNFIRLYFFKYYIFALFLKEAAFYYDYDN